MRARMRVLLFASLFLVIGGFAFGQSAAHDIDINIVNVAMIGINDGGDGTTLTTQNPLTAGDVVGGSSDAITIDYTSLANAARVVTALITANAEPAGTLVQIEATDASIPANCGDAVAAATLNGGNQAGGAIDVINNFQSCNTGIGSGTTITYTLIIDDATSLVAGASSTITVTLTVQDD